MPLRLLLIVYPENTFFDFGSISLLLTINNTFSCLVVFIYIRYISQPKNSDINKLTPINTYQIVRKAAFVFFRAATAFQCRFQRAENKGNLKMGPFNR